MQNNADFSAADYLSGRVKLPPWFSGLKQKSYQYNDSISIANGLTKTLQIQIQSDSYYMVEGINIIPSVIGAYESATVQISDTTTSQPWSNEFVNLRDIAGRGDNPKYLTDPNLLRPSSTLNIAISNSQGSTQQFYVMIFGRKVYGLTTDQVNFLTRRMWFQYQLDLPAILAGVTSQYASVNILNESDFLCKRLMGTSLIQFVVNTASAGSVSSEIMMQLRDMTADNNFFSQKVAARLVVGSQWASYKSGGASFTNGQGFGFKRPILIRRNGVVQGEFDNLSATNLSANTGYVVMEGVRIFDAV